MVVSSIAGLVSQIIPAEHIPSFLQNGHYFAPCSSFVDLMEFRYGYCLFNSVASTAAQMQTCIQGTFKNSDINRCIESAYVSCWTRRRPEKAESCAMWEVYGRGEAAIQVTVEAQKFFAYIKTRHPQCIGGHVTYAGQTSMVHPEMWELGSVTQEQRDNCDLFFHKHGFYAWENEFRTVIFANERTLVPISDDLIESVITSPFGKLSPNTERSLRERFNTRVSPSRLIA